MNKCFITKLPSSVDNDNLPVLGQLRINWLKQSNLTDNDQRAVGISTVDSITVKVSGAHFTDNTLTNNLGNIKTITATDGEVWLYVSNDADAILTIDNKYSLVRLNFVKAFKDKLIRSVYFDINDIKYCTNLNNLALANTQVGGDISAVSNLVGLNHLALIKTQVSGDISAVSKCINITELYLMYSQISGDIAVLANLTKLTGVLQLQNLSITGDMSKIPANINCIYNQNRPINTNFTWTAGGRQNVTLLAMQDNIPFDTVSMDNMFIDQATCAFKPTASNPLTNTISVKGTRTSASDAAVTAIQNKGVTITGVTKQA